jgi:hypothetical protein
MLGPSVTVAGELVTPLTGVQGPSMLVDSNSVPPGQVNVK